MSMTIGADGFPVISYQDFTNWDLEFAKCNNASCSSASTSTLDSVGDVGQHTAIAIGSDGFPVIVYGDANNARVNFVKCSDISCSGNASSTTGYATSTLVSDYDYGASLAIGTDGLPAIVFRSNSTDLEFIKCHNVSCSALTNSSLDTQGATGYNNSMAIGTDGYPVIMYQYNTGLDLNFAKCNNIACAPDTSATGTLSATSTDLGNYLDDAAYTNVASSDDVYDSLSAGTSTRLAYLFTKKHTDNTNFIGITWEGQVSRATSTYLKIFNYASSTWETLASNLTPTVNTDFALAATQTASVSNYYDTSNIVYLRIETGTTTASTTLKTDYVNFSQPTLAQTAYIFLNDNGTTTDTYTKAHSAATSTAITGVKKGEKLIARIQIDNTGTGTSTAQYRLQWENQTDAEGTWSDLSTTTQIQWSLSEKGALPSRYGQVPLATNQVGTCTTTTTFSSGLFVAGAATSSVLALGPTKCTELAYAIDTSGATLNRIYRLRLVTGSTTIALDAYTKYPTFTIESAQDIRYSKEVKGGYSTTTLANTGNVGQHTSIAIGSDGFPVISYQDVTLGNLNFAHCNNLSCSSYTTSSLDTGGDVGEYTSIAIGSDGFPVIAYRDYDTTRRNLNFAKCNNISCSSVSTSSLDWGGDVGQYSSIAIGTDGFPVIAYYDNDNANLNLNFAKCNNIACTSVATSSLVTGGIVGWYPSITIGSDGFPVIPYYSQTDGFLHFAKCNNIACTSVVTSSLDAAVQNVA
jgi:hypothetical protein